MSIIRELAAAAASKPTPLPAVVGFAGSTSEVRAAWRLVHDEYVSARIMAARDDGVHAPEALLRGVPYVLVRRVGDRVDSTLSVIPDSGRGLPADQIAAYHAALGRLRATGARVMELGMFARQRSVRSTSLGGASMRSDDASVGVQELFGSAYALAQREGATHFVVTVHPRHARYYAQGFGFTELSGRAGHPSVDGAPAVLLVADLRFTPELVSRLTRLGQQLPNVLPGTTERADVMRRLAAELGRGALQQHATY